MKRFPTLTDVRRGLKAGNGNGNGNEIAINKIETGLACNITYYMMILSHKVHFIKLAKFLISFRDRYNSSAAAGCAAPAL